MGDGTSSHHNVESGDPPLTSATANFDSLFGLPPTPFDPQEATPSASGSAQTDPEKDPFLSLLEQLAENEHSHGGPSELDFFLGNTTSS